MLGVIQINTANMLIEVLFKFIANFIAIISHSGGKKQDPFQISGAVGFASFQNQH